MATEAGTAFVALIPSARGFARALKKDIAKEFAGSKLDTLIADAFAGTSVSVPVKPTIRPGDVPDELPVRPGQEPTLPVRLDPLTKQLQDDVRRELGVLTRDVSARIDVDADTADLRTDIATAISQVEASLRAQVPTEPAGRREYERQLRAQVAEVSRTVRARIEADVDVDKSLRDGRINAAGETIGRSLASSIVSSLGSGLSTLAGPATFIGVIAAAALAGPLVGAALAGGILAAIGGGVIGLGIVALAGDPRLKSAATKLSTTIKDTLAKAAGPLLGTEQAPGPLLRAMETLQKLVVEIGPSLEKMFAAIGPYIPGLAEGIADFVRAVMPGLLAAVQAAGPILEVIALNLGPLGQAVGNFLALMAALGPAAADALNVIFYLINHVIGVAGNLIYALGAAFGGLFQWVKELRASIAAGWAHIVQIFTGGNATVKQRIEALIGSAIRLFTGLWDKLTGGARKALSSVASTFGGLRGRITSAVGNLGGLLYGAGRSIIQGLINGIRSMFAYLQSTLNWVTSVIPSWKGPPSRDRKLLEPAGSSIMGGLIRGIRGELPALRSELGGVTALVAGTPLAAAAAGGYGLSTPAPAPAPLVAQWVGGDGDPIIRAIREHTRIYYGGSPNMAFGSG
ncbi:hypothetical protein OG992_18655 [Micromonospora sp. NBC_00362]|uniref:hypothetical protein n=1 Tax=Micromonospora sp. NBC_00362 TaxID=2975975 RepID=UPI002255707F|nr:hypothetical protein [Micromonospora sp. NBC_00362]MCX5119210.1 hypothetical protein [Micromonospora sp. NBC_00362]